MGGILGAVNEAETHGGTEGKDTQEDESWVILMEEGKGRDRNEARQRREGDEKAHHEGACVGAGKAKEEGEGEGEGRASVCYYSSFHVPWQRRRTYKPWMMRLCVFIYMGGALLLGGYLQIVLARLPPLPPPPF